jgi:CheY-like chemotaxis protein
MQGARRSGDEGVVQHYVEETDQAQRSSRGQIRRRSRRLCDVRIKGGAAGCRIAYCVIREQALAPSDGDPVAAATAVQPGTGFSSRGSEGKAMTEKRILVVDDEPFILRSLTYVLKKNGYRVDTATNGDEALEQITAHKPSLVFLDLMMPKKNGYEVCEHVRGIPELSHIHIIMLTAKGQDVNREKGFKAGANEYMTKPFSPSQVLERVRQLMD